MSFSIYAHFIIYYTKIIGEFIKIKLQVFLLKPNTLYRKLFFTHRNHIQVENLNN